MNPKNRMRPIHPGEVLREEFLLPLDLSSNRLAQAIGVPANRISEIVAEERAITADTALRLSAALGTTPEFWLNLQKSYELRLAEQDKETAKAVRGIQRVATAR
jgi:antitoxin HigA-1